MKEEILKMLKGIELKNEEGNRFYTNYASILKNFERSIKRIEECYVDDEDVYNKVKNSVEEFYKAEDDFDKFRIINNIQHDIVVTVF